MENKSWNLNKNAWHVRLMKFIWNLSYRDFNWLCIYFWLSVFNILFLPAILFIKLIFNTFTFFFKKLNKWSEVRIETREIVVTEKNKATYRMFIMLKENEWELFLRNLPKSQVWSFINYVYTENRVVGNALTRIYEIVELEKQRLKERKKKTKQQKILAIYKIVKPIATVTLYLLSAGAIFLAGWGIYWIFTSGNSGKALSVLGLILAAVAGVLIIGLIGSFLSVIFSNNKQLRKNFSRPFKWTWRKIKSPFVLIGKIISDNCPAINWTDK